MLELFKAWLHAVFVNQRVRAAFWGMIGTVMVVELPTVPDATMPQWAKLLLQLAVGTLIPWVADLVKKQVADASKELK